MAFKYPLNPYGNLMTFPVALAGGLVDSKAIPTAGDLQTLSNFVVYRNRFALRAPVTSTVQLLDDVGAGAAITSVLALRFHNGFAYAVGFSSVTNKYYLYKLTASCAPQGDHVVGNTQQPLGTSGIVLTGAGLWSSTSGIIPIMVSFAGGTPTAPANRLFLCDTTGQNPSLFETEPANVITLNNVIDHFDDNVTARNSQYSYMWKYQYTMWGSGYFQTGVVRPEMMRFSQPGLIHANEPDVTNQDDGNGREWWSVDHREVGDRGDTITNVGYAGGAAIVFKRRSCYALYGYDADTWAIRPISDKVGAVGPYASTSTEDGMCFFWSDRGPHMTDGQNVYDIGPNIRKLVQQIGFNQLIAAEYSVDDSIVYYSVPTQGNVTPNMYVGYQRQPSGGNTPPQGVSQPGSPLGLFSTGTWQNASGSAMAISTLASVPNQTPPGPIAPPTGIAATATGDTTITVTWTNGDTAQDVTTNIYRSTSAFSGGNPPNAGNLITTVASGVNTFGDTGLSQTTQYFYTVVHVRNSILNPTSGWATPSATTWVSPPTNLSANGNNTNGVTVSGNVTAGDNVAIYSRKAGVGAFTLLTTLINPGASWTVNDATGPCNTALEYQVKAQKATFTDSVFVAVPGVAYACVVGAVITSVTAQWSASGGAAVCGDNYPVVSWSGNQFRTYDSVNIYRKDDAGSFTLVGSQGILVNGSTFTDYLFVQNGSHTHQWRVDAIESGSVTSSVTSNTLSSNLTGCKS